jgi:processive 1,2-diacylglycerol beta-glucosyltransferase
MNQLYNKLNGELIGEITDTQLQFLIDQMEEESLEDRDYAITRMELDYFDAQGAEPDLLSMLRSALGNKDEISIIWQKVE